MIKVGHLLGKKLGLEDLQWFASVVSKVFREL